MTMEQIGSFCKQVGFNTEAKLSTAIAVAWAESSGNETVVNSLGCTGLFQIYVRVHLPAHPTWTTAAMKIPYNNCKAAYELSSGGSNWKPWEAYTNGAYKRYIGPATTAAKKVLGLQVGSTPPVGTPTTPPPAGPSLVKTMSWFANQIGYVNAGGARYWNLTTPSLNGQSWCGAFIHAGLKANGIDIKAMGCSNPYYCPTIVQWAQSAGRWTQTPKPGYLALFCWDSSGVAQHVEIVEKVFAAKDVQCIGGNTTDNNRGSINNGYGVWRNRRSSGILGYVRIDFDPSATATDQSQVGGDYNVEGTRITVQENGAWNMETALELAKQANIPMPLSTNEYYWRNIEEWVGLEGKYLDGDLDYVTIQALQWRTNQDIIDGQWNSRTILGIQKYLNINATP